MYELVIVFFCLTAPASECVDLAPQPPELYFQADDCIRRGYWLVTEYLERRDVDLRDLSGSPLVRCELAL